MYKEPSSHPYPRSSSALISIFNASFDHRGLPGQPHPVPFQNQFFILFQLTQSSLLLTLVFNNLPLGFLFRADIHCWSTLSADNLPLGFPFCFDSHGRSTLSAVSSPLCIPSNQSPFCFGSTLAPPLDRSILTRNPRNQSGGAMGFVARHSQCALCPLEGVSQSHHFPSRRDSVRVFSVSGSLEADAN